MRQFVIDELSREERNNIENYLKRTLDPGPMAGLYWLKLPDDLLADNQQGHTGCRPFCFGVLLDDDVVRFELLVRSQTTLHCDCIAHATPAQREFVLRYVDKLLTEEMIRA